jgi:DNA-binding LacI/PurR family transcriptional regulator
MALIGFDDSTWAEAIIPPLTTVRQPGYELGVHAAELLIKRLNKRDANTMTIVLNPELVVRESCGSRAMVST